MKVVRNTARTVGAMALLTLLVGSLVGCSRTQAPPLEETPKKVEKVEMPDLSMTEVDDVGKELTERGLKVLVVRPAFTVTSGEKTTKPGTTFSVEEFKQPFKEKAWDHWVTVQDPAPGTMIDVGTTVTLTAGEHLGSAPGKTWLEAHGEAVKKDTDKECLESCHKKDHCTDCHDKAGVKDEAAPKSK